ncbi:MAG: DNA-binding transcriptional regulator Fis [Pseudomonadales bacterium]|jgi:Fis family transcriptional regulator|nr:DNA-binding transcriptional regulator Fis [Pseudomonadales bacterium]
MKPLPEFAAIAPSAVAAPPGQTPTLRHSVSTALSAYLSNVDEDFIRDFYATVLAEVEPPLLAAVMHKARSNQSRAALMLGLNRATLRKKLRQYHLLD